GPAHALDVTESGALGDAVEGRAPGFDQGASGLDPQSLDSLRRGDAGLGHVGTGKTARAHLHARGQRRDPELAIEPLADPAVQFAEAPLPRAELEQARVLGLSAGALSVNDELARHVARD